jgi:S1-C subfamily serine protease
MKPNLLRLATSGLVVLGTATGILTLDAVTPMEILSLSRSHSHQALAQTSEDVGVRVYRRAGPAVVSIQTETGTGSGIIISADGLVLTNAHVVEGSQRVTVILADDRRFEAEVIGFGDAGLDLAAVQISGQRNLPTIEIAPSNSVEVGQQIFAIGDPFGQFRGTLTTGIISRVDRQRNILQTDAAINPGNSGGPLLNSQGQLIGVNTAIFNPEEAVNIGISFAIPVEEIQPFLTSVREGTASNIATTPGGDGITQPPEAISLNGAPIQGQLTPNSDILPSDSSYFNAYSFEGRAGQDVDIIMRSSQVDAYLILIAPDGTASIQDNDTGGGRDARITTTLPQDGTYTLLANTYGSGETGQYSLVATTDGSAPSGGSSSSTSGFLLQEEGNLSSNSFVLPDDGSLFEEHVFQGRAGQTVTITLESREFDTYLILLDPNDQLVDYNDDISSDNLNSSLTVRLSETGSYRIIAKSYDPSGRGRYWVTVR